jgi:hypothetical protein
MRHCDTFLRKPPVQQRTSVGEWLTVAASEQCHTSSSRACGDAAIVLLDRKDMAARRSCRRSRIKPQIDNVALFDD